MSLSARQQVTYWGLFAVLFSALLWGLGNVMVPFIVGSALAYFLDPVADRLERLGLSRMAATGVISVGSLLLFIVILLLIVPTLIRQAAQLIEAAPTIATRVQEYLTAQFPSLTEEGGTLRKALDSLARAIQARAGELAGGILSSALSVINAIVFMVVVPIVTIYMLLDWDHTVARIDALLPLEHRDTIRRLASEIDTVLAGFVRGQVTVCIILGTFYSVALMLAGLDYGLVVGAVAGCVTFIPYLGALVGGGLAIGLALYQFWGDWLQIALIAGIFAFGQFIEGNIITPRLVGQSVGLHPVWLLFALAAFGTLFGFVGMLVAVPVAAAIGVMIRFAVSRYLESPLYRGSPGPDQG